MNILVSEVRVRNYRSLKNVNVKLGKVVLLVGANNAGKTSFLRAVQLSLGLGRSVVNKDDIHVEQGENLPKSREATIDVLIIPVDDKGKRNDSFDSAWSEHWGLHVQTDDQDRQFLGIRTIIKYNILQNEYSVDRYSLDSWQDDPKDWENAKIQREKLPRRLLENMPMYFIDAQRDVKEDLRDRSSYWGKLVSDINIDEKQKKRIERILAIISKKITKDSSVLAHITQELELLNQVISKTGEEVSITPVPRKVSDLNKGMDIHYKDAGSESFPISHHGMGTRSWATLLTFKAYVKWLTQQMEDNDSPFHPILALEEPEAHLHPQAQRYIYQQLCDFHGQKIISTHSPYIASMAEIDELRHFSKNGSQTYVNMIDTSDLLQEDIRKIQREVMNTRGELLFARALVLFEGETEEQALPIFATSHWKRHPHELGVTFIGVGGVKYLPFLRVAEGLKIDWFIISDGEHKTVTRVNDILKKIGLPECDKLERVKVIGGDRNFESYLIDEGYSDELITAIGRVDGEDYFGEFIEKNHGTDRKARKREATCPTCKQNLVDKITRDYKSGDGETVALLDCLTSGKTKYGPSIAEVISETSDAERQIPKIIKELLIEVDKVLLGK